MGTTMSIRFMNYSIIAHVLGSFGQNRQDYEDSVIMIVTHSHR